MLLHLSIRNFAIIDHVDVDFQAGFTVVTGETGAGKSILVNALTLALGGRSNTDVVRAGAKSAEVEVLFDISQHPVVRARLEQRELVGDDPDSLLIKRSVSAKGRGKVVINGSLATVATLSELVKGLVDISGQHEQQTLLIVENHLDILDSYGDLENLRADYRQAYEHLKRLRRDRLALERNAEDQLKRSDYVRFQLEEIERLDPVFGEDVELEAEVKRLAHAERLRHGVSQVEGFIYGDDGSAFDKIGKAAAELDALARIDPMLANVCEALDTARREIEEASRTLQDYGESIEADPDRLAEKEERLADLRRLCRKHGGDLEDVLAQAESMRQELSTFDNREQHAEKLDGAIATAQSALLLQAKHLSKKRHHAARQLKQAVEQELREMDLAEAEIVVDCAALKSTEGVCIDDSWTGPQGLDSVEFLWSANPGEPKKPLARIASGGELSRLMLAVKSVLRNRDLVSLYVFDEVDTGLGGRAADFIGRKIQNVAEGHQAITITHLAPIAARA
ncbi:MAG: DNA repair protein RecN, partial [Myxococcota bacterium]